MKEVINVDLPKIQTIPVERKKLSNIEEVFSFVCKHKDVDPKKVCSRSRKREYLTPRQMYCRLAHDLFKKDVSLREIGRVVDYNHTTVIYSIKQTRKGYPLYDEYEKLKRSL